MTETRKTSGWTANRLRTRFVPKSRIRHGLVSMSPWLDLVLILLFFLFTESRILLQPGIVVELPAATFEEGVETGMIAVVVALDRPEGRSEIVFFDDEPYAVDDEIRMTELKVALADYRKGHTDTALTLYADRTVSHGTVSRLVQMARGVGVERVNMGMQAEME
jgi:biopolymer transport protein ExbD